MRYLYVLLLYLPDVSPGLQAFSAGDGAAHKEKKKYMKDRFNVTVHSVLSNTLRDAQKLPKPQFRAAKLGIFTQKRVKTPRGTVACEQ